MQAITEQNRNEWNVTGVGKLPETSSITRTCLKNELKRVIEMSCWMQVSYAIGVAEPLSITVFDYGTSKYSQGELLDIVRKNFDLRPGHIASALNLKNPIYQKTSTYGHFGREIFTWEQPKTLVL